MKIYISLFLLFFTSIILAQQTGAIQGTVLDNEMNQEPLAFASISVKNSNTNSTSDLYGTYYMDLEPGAYTLVLGFPGYEKVEIPNIIIKEGEVTELETILMTAHKGPRISSDKAKTIALKEMSSASLSNN